jgi:anti-sigma factor RsiW
MTDTRSVTDRTCEAIRIHLSGRSRGDLAAEAESQIQSHLQGCPACRQVAVALDPTAIFTTLRRESLPDGFWTEFDKTLHTRLIAEEDASWAARARRALEAAFRPPRLTYVAAPLAMVLALGVTLYVARPGFLPSGRPHRPADGLQSPYEQTTQPRREPLRAPVAVAAGSLIDSPPPLEEVASPRARVYRLDVAGQDPTPVYFVVDESIEF